MKATLEMCSSLIQTIQANYLLEKPQCGGRLA